MINNFPAGRGGGRSNARALFVIWTVTLGGVTTRFAKCAGAVHAARLAMAGNGGEVRTTALHAGGMLGCWRTLDLELSKGRKSSSYDVGAVEGSSARRRCSRRSNLRRRSTLEVWGEWCGSVGGLRAGMCEVLRSEHTTAAT